MGLYRYMYAYALRAYFLICILVELNHFMKKILLLDVWQISPAGHYRPSSETPLERRFADGPIVARW